MHRQPLIVVPDDEPPVVSGTSVAEQLKQLGELVIYDTRAIGEAVLTERLKEAEVAYTVRATSVFTRRVMQACPNLKLISIFGVGYDNVDVAVADELGVAVANTPGYSAVAVAETALALALSVAHRVVENDRSVRSGGWALGYTNQLYGKTLGVIGTGSIGCQMIKIARGIGMKVVAWTYNATPERAAQYGVEFLGLDDLLKTSDVVSLHLRGTREAEKMIGARELGLMKKTALLINTARGPLVDEAALVAALEQGQIAGAGLDVFTKEPLPGGHPLTRLDNVVLLPHVGSLIPEATLGGMTMAADNVANFLNGNPTNIVNCPARR